MSCGRITPATGVGSGQFSRNGCCWLPNYGPFSSGIDQFGVNIGANFYGLLLAGDPGGGGGNWGGDANFGGNGITPGDDGGGGNWYDGDANWGGDGITPDDDPPPNCLAYGAEVMLYDGRVKAIELLLLEDEVASIMLPRMLKDEHDGQYQFLERSLDTTVVPGRIESIRHGFHSGVYVINHAIRATFEHPFLIRRGKLYGFSPADALREGDLLQSMDGEVEITSIKHEGSKERTVSLHVPGVNTFLANGVWTHNAYYDTPPIVGGSSGGADSGGKSSGGFGSF